MGEDRRTLVTRHIGLVQRIARRIHRDVGAHIELDDLVSFGAAGLLEAAGRYDPERGATFATFAHYRIRGAIYDGMRRMGVLPRGQYRRAIAAQHTDNYLESLSRRAEHSRQPGSHACEALTLQHAHELYDCIRTVQAIFITALATEREGELNVADPALARTDDLVLEKQRLEKLEQSLAQLPERERHLIQRTYFEGIALGKAGAELGLSASWTSRLHARAVERLRDLLADTVD